MNLRIRSFVHVIAIISWMVVSTDAIMEDKILQFLEEVRNRMCYPLFGLPALDPLQIENANFSMNNKYLADFTGSVTDFRLNGLSNFNVTSLKISTIPFKRSNANIVFPFADVKSLYTAKGSLAYLIDLNGNDKAEVQIEDLKLWISWNFKTGLSVGIKNLKIGISIGNLFVNIKNLTEEPRLNHFLHALINEMGIELLNDLWVIAQDKGVTKYIEKTLNMAMDKYTLNDILKIINSISGGEGPPFGGIPADCKTVQILYSCTQISQMQY